MSTPIEFRKPHPAPTEIGYHYRLDHITGDGELSILPVRVDAYVDGTLYWTMSGYPTKFTIAQGGSWYGPVREIRHG